MNIELTKRLEGFPQVETYETDDIQIRRFSTHTDGKQYLIETHRLPSYINGDGKMIYIRQHFLALDRPYITK